MFSYVVLLSAALLAVCAAWFSVSGIAQLFAGAGLAAGFMASALELGKLVGVSFLYRYRKTIPKTLRVYMWTGTVVLMLITSVGIYGYLSSAYASSAKDIQNKQNDIALYTTQQQTVENDIKRLTDRSSQLQNLRAQQENRLDEFVRLGRSTSTQQRIIREQESEIKKLQTKISSLSKTRDSLSLAKTTVTNSITTTGKLGTFYYVAQTIGVPLDTIVKWFIIVLVTVFDPMSIALFIAYNVIIEQQRNKKDMSKHGNSEVESDVALEPIILPFEHIKTDIDTTELSKNPYYMQPGYDWQNDTRWHDDPDARGFKGTLGY